MIRKIKRKKISLPGEPKGSILGGRSLFITGTDKKGKSGQLLFLGI